MSLTPQTIKSTDGSRRKGKRLGRGNGSQKGTYSGRGMKGQRSRSGGKGGGKLRGLKQMLQKVPKLRGFKSLQAKKSTVTLVTLERITKDGDVVTPYSLNKSNAAKNPANGVKIVGTGTFAHKITLQGCVASKTAVQAIEKAGGTIVF